MCRDIGGHIQPIAAIGSLAGSRAEVVAVGRVCRRLTLEERIEIRRLHKQGLPIQKIAKMMSRSWPTINAVMRPTVATEERLWDPSPARLSMADREEIRVGIVAGDTFSAIAGKIEKSVSTVSREVAKNGGRQHY